MYFISIHWIPDVRPLRYTINRQPDNFNFSFSHLATLYNVTFQSFFLVLYNFNLQNSNT